MGRSPRHRASKIERARQYLVSGGVARDDSDDELGLEDHPWEWIYETSSVDNAVDVNEEGENPDSSSDGEKAAAALNAITRRKRKAQRPRSPEGKIVGARMGKFECKVGDIVLLKAESNNEAWVGIICEFSDEEDEKVANFMWFSTANEIRNKEKKRNDNLQVWMSIGLSWMGTDLLERAIYITVLGYESPRLYQWQSLHPLFG
jgi:origin recognition complex subunit 1